MATPNTWWVTSCAISVTGQSDPRSDGSTVPNAVWVSAMYTPAASALAPDPIASKNDAESL